MAELKRLAVKYIRDRAKSKYNKGSECEICGATEELEFHHFSSLTALMDRWLLRNKIKVENSEDIMSVRDSFIEEHHAEIYNETTTLCSAHHQQLHGIYGKKPNLGSAKKQARWVIKQKEKHGLV